MHHLTTLPAHFFKENLVIEKDIDKKLSQHNLIIPFNKNDYPKETSSKGLNYKITRNNFNQIFLEIDAPHHGIVYWSDSFDKRWEVKINGKDHPLLKANLNFKAFFIPKGFHKISLRFNPIKVKIAITLFYLCLLIGVVPQILFIISSNFKAIANRPKERNRGPEPVKA